ncbi:MAG: molybdopterin molybdotransferase MoeA [Pirellulaceae bacterium]|nr:molybdopterin molybdotransferase MoeA [Pirellulaceae bacterium]
MIPISEALDKVLAEAGQRPARRLPLSQAVGLVLAENVASDIDSPPHDKAMVDGYAIRASDVAAGHRELTVLEEVFAGMVPSLAVNSGTATRIMTGAPIPPGADAVVMVERTSGAAETPADAAGGRAVRRIRIDEPAVEQGQNIMRRGTSLQRGQQVLAAGCRLRAIEIGLLAEVGRAEVLAVPRPGVAVLATGNELVPAGTTPGAGQIRNSNGPLLVAAVQTLGAEPLDLGIARDEPDDLAERIGRGLEQDVLLLSGGVSAGVLDLVPQALQSLGVRQVFHKVDLKPGKPLWFGVLERPSRRTLVFGLPGNPVSSLVCFHLFVRPALARLAGHGNEPLATREARLEAGFRHRGDRATCFPSRLFEQDGLSFVRTLDWKGSADQRTLVEANCLTLFPPGDRDYAAGELVPVYPL